MAELKLPRLLGAAKEFNIGQDTLLTFWRIRVSNDLKPTSKLTEEMYRALQQEFQSDKVAKLKSDRLNFQREAELKQRRKKMKRKFSLRKR